MSFYSVVSTKPVGCLRNWTAVWHVSNVIQGFVIYWNKCDLHYYHDNTYWICSVSERAGLLYYDKISTCVINRTYSYAYTCITKCALIEMISINNWNKRIKYIHFHIYVSMQYSAKHLKFEEKIKTLYDSATYIFFIYLVCNLFLSHPLTSEKVYPSTNSLRKKVYFLRRFLTPCVYM